MFHADFSFANIFILVFFSVANVAFFLAHLVQRSVRRPSTIHILIFSSETTWPIQTKLGKVVKWGFKLVQMVVHGSMGSEHLRSKVLIRASMEKNLRNLLKNQQ